ncbi:hypothetical protein AU193_01395 [Mycobacterium sp. GA-1285]|uniref:DUF732 domain-containing protein n=1 Tax=Mycobacterium sp. GA-1285 TaxID=1772282 RepID=UPI000747C04E|nr:hypothetical protein AU193_01395 [Mycobacterium sp. GA-1285]
MQVANADPGEDAAAANAVFISLLTERGMYSPAQESGPYTAQYLIKTGRYVCQYVDQGMPLEQIQGGIVRSGTGWEPDDLRNTIFAALSIRTFCPPTPSDRSY